MDNNEQLPAAAPETDDLPPCLIRVDEDGHMWHRGAEITHEGISSLLRDNVELDERGRYVIVLDGRRCRVEVEDTFFVVTRLSRIPDGGDARYEIILNDGTREDLDPSTLVRNQFHILYTRVKGGRFPARFLRKSYYQLAEYVGERDDEYGLIVKGRFFPIGFRAD